jgi:hypothetical protein
MVTPQKKGHPKWNSFRASTSGISGFVNCAMEEKFLLDFSNREYLSANRRSDSRMQEAQAPEGRDLGKIGISLRIPEDQCESRDWSVKEPFGEKLGFQTRQSRNVSLSVCLFVVSLPVVKGDEQARRTRSMLLLVQEPCKQTPSLKRKYPLGISHFSKPRLTRRERYKATITMYRG